MIMLGIVVWSASLNFDRLFARGAMFDCGVGGNRFDDGTFDDPALRRKGSTDIAVKLEGSGVQSFGSAVMEVSSKPIILPHALNLGWYTIPLAVTLDCVRTDSQDSRNGGADPRQGRCPGLIEGRTLNGQIGNKHLQRSGSTYKSMGAYAASLSHTSLETGVVSLIIVSPTHRLYEYKNERPLQDVKAYLLVETSSLKKASLDRPTPIIPSETVEIIGLWERTESPAFSWFWGLKVYGKLPTFYISCSFNVCTLYRSSLPTEVECGSAIA
jgi:hypothetical protein